MELISFENNQNFTTTERVWNLAKFNEKKDSKKDQNRVYLNMLLVVI